MGVPVRMYGSQIYAATCALTENVSSDRRWLQCKILLAYPTAYLLHLAWQKAAISYECVWWDVEDRGNPVSEARRVVPSGFFLLETLSDRPLFFYAHKENS